ncbi:AI-2E family transporter [Acetobacteraceae bacterium KSS8]|uniref:AI-2E family transporter n=1 Tax=Endosaccharibacter trunci TaxID=2812733 RepID=A0ABT1W5B8_9PROT|nr:AI-2E family transporter [Acetobacteraceae bacterium KSS8]
MDARSDTPQAGVSERDVGSATDPRAAALNRIYALLRLALATTFVLLAVWLVKDVLTVVFAACLLAVILHGVARLVQRFTRMPFWVSLTLVVLAMIGLFAGFVLVAGPGLADQAVKLKQALSDQAHGLHDRLAGTNWGDTILNQLPASLGGNRQGGANGGIGAGSISKEMFGSVAGILGSVFGLFGTLLVIVVAGLYLAASPETYANGVLRLVSKPHRPHARTLLQAAGNALWAWSAGQALDMLVVGVLSGLGLWAIGVPLALVLGVVAGLCNFVPYIGAAIGAIPAIVIAFSVGSGAGLETCALYAVIQGFEGNVMAPLIQNRAVHLPPGLTILSQTAFGAILGVPGLIFATPLTAAILAVMGKATPSLSENEKL